MISRECWENVCHAILAITSNWLTSDQAFFFPFFFFEGQRGGGGGGGGKEEMRCREEECDRRLQIGRRAPPAARATRGFPARA